MVVQDGNEDLRKELEKRTKAEASANDLQQRMLAQLEQMRLSNEERDKSNAERDKSIAEISKSNAELKATMTEQYQALNSRFARANDLYALKLVRRLMLEKRILRPLSA